MPETRRDLFKTSVLSARGGFVANGVAACTPSGFLPKVCPKPPDPPNAGSVVAIHDYKMPAWYLFHFGTDKGNCTLYNTCKSSVQHETKADTQTWLSVAGTLATEGTTIWYKTEKGTGKLVVTLFDSANHYYLTPTSLEALLSLVDNPPHAKGGTQVGGSWNEIGKQ